MMLLKIGQQKKSSKFETRQNTNQKIQKMSKMHVYIVKYGRLNTWDTHVPMGTKEVKKTETKNQNTVFM